MFFFLKKKTLFSNKFLLFIFILLIACSIIFHNLPNDIFKYMLDLSFGFNQEKVFFTYESLGEIGRKNYIYSALILDTIFPFLYALFFILVSFKNNINNKFLIFIPILSGAFDILENILISKMMSSKSFEDISLYEIFFGSIFNQCKWILISITLLMIVFKIMNRRLV